MQESELPQQVSKTQRKKQMIALQDIGKILVELPALQLAKIPLEPSLADAVNEARKLKGHEAKRRQLQFIGKIMRTIDAAPILEALDKCQLKDQVSIAQLHQVERWRDKLIAKGDSVLQEFLLKYPHADSQHLRQLTRKSQQDVAAEKNSGAQTALFRYLREIMDSAS